ncbi:MAG: penicillin-binding protein 2 [Acidimicrobiales bacterium]|nr:penicillin-binding protein 2 [Acidimicrobiales bacterium]
MTRTTRRSALDWPVEPPPSALRADRSVVRAVATGHGGRRSPVPPGLRSRAPSPPGDRTRLGHRRPVGSIHATPTRSRHKAAPPPPPPRPSLPVRLARGAGQLSAYGGQGVYRGLRSALALIIEATSPPKGPRVVDERDLRRVSAKATRRRLLGVLGAVVLLFSVMVTKLVFLQLVDPDVYERYSTAQRTHVETLAADRGSIFDRNGVELAISIPQRSVFVDPALVEDPSAEAPLLAGVLGLDPAVVEEKMRADNRFAYIARHIPDDLAKRVAELDLPGVAFVDEPRRFFPSGNLARSIVGQTDVDGNGISGLEKQYGDVLTGTPGRMVFEKTPDGKTIPVGRNHVEPAIKGNDLVLTIDRTVQFEVERILGEQVKAADAKGGIAIVSRPATGEILAMANMVYDRRSGEVVSTSNNEALTTVYEPGSVMKLVTASGAIEDGKVTPDTVLQLPPVLQIADAQFTDSHPRGAVAWSVKQIIAESSNIGTIKMAQMLGKERLYEYLRSFGFGERTALEFPNEAAGHLMRPEDWWATSLGTIPIGQGVSVTPLQMLLAYNVVAAGGTYVPPKLVSETIDSQGVRHPTSTGETRRVLTEKTANQLNVMLREVVGEGTGKLAAVDGYTVAGKTGTARKPGNGSYRDENGVTQYQATFVGFAPAEDPEISVIVIIDEPGAGNIFGGTVAAPAFSKITQFVLRVLGVPPPSVDGPKGGVAADAGAQARAAAKLDPSKPVQTASERVRARPAGETPTNTATTTGASTVVTIVRPTTTSTTARSRGG